MFTTINTSIKKTYSRFLRNSEANVSEFPENIGEMFLCYEGHYYSDVKASELELVTTDSNISLAFIVLPMDKLTVLLKMLTC